MTLPPDIIRAARKYGGLVDQLAHSRYHISGTALLAKLVQGESGGRPDRTSNAGAQGYTQFMPGSRRVAIDKYGVDPLAGPDQAVHAAALHLLGKINGSTGLEGYNPGSPTYKDFILGQKVGDVHHGQSQGSGPSGGGGQRVSGSVTPGSTSGAGFDPGQDAPLLAGLLAQPDRVPVQTPVPVAPHARGPVVQGPAPLVAQGGVEGLLQAIRTPAQEIPDATTSAGSTRVTTGGQPRASASRVSGSGTVRVSPTANRAGADLTPGILKLVRAVSARAGRPITIGTGTNHDRLTVDGNVSDHYEGNAADLPTTPGHDNITLGRQALVALGMPRAEAQRAGGGIYNLPYGRHRRIQVIFNTNAGGNHHDHVHVGVTSVRGR